MRKLVCADCAELPLTESSCTAAHLRLSSEAMELVQEVTAALSQPAGANAALIDSLLAAYFSNALPGELVAGTHTYKLHVPEEADKLFRHVAGGTWAPALVRAKLPAMAHDRLLALGFKDAPWSDVEAFVAINSIPIARMLELREDAPDVLLAFAKTATARRVKNGALAAAIARSNPVPEGMESEFDLTEAGWSPLLRAALKALGPERASAVAIRTMRLHDEDEPQLRSQAIIPVLECFGPLFSPTGEHRLAERVEELSRAPGSYQWWEEVGSRLASSHEWDAVIAFARSRLEVSSGWRRALRVILDERVRTGWKFDASFEELIDPAHAAQQGYDVRKSALRLLEAIPAARAEVLLTGASWVQPADALHFLRAGFSDAYLDRIAELLVSLADDPAHKDTLIATSLRPLGSRFGKALERALADVKPKQSFLNALERNLDAPVFAELSTWLALRPPPKPKKKPKSIAGSSEETVKIPGPKKQ